MAESARVHDAFIDELCDTYGVERQLTNAPLRAFRIAIRGLLRRTRCSHGGTVGAGRVRFIGEGVAGQMTAKRLKAASGGERGQLAIFRTLEALAGGVQGKRCMWRALQLITPQLRASGRRSFVALETRCQPMGIN